jgi:hypothetical protein
MQFASEITAIDFKFDSVAVAAAVSSSGVKLFDIRKLDRALDLKIDQSIEVETLAFQQKTIDDPLFADFIQVAEEPQKPEIPEVVVV